MKHRALLLALLAVALPGCAAWDAEKLDLTKLRDPRAAELDRRLSERPEPVTSPFGQAEVR